MTNAIPGGTPAASSDVPQLGDTPQAVPEKLIGGKYKTIDEAVIASDRGYHEVNEKLSKIVGVLEAAMQPQQPQYGYQGVPVGQQPQQQYADPYGRGQPVDTIDPTAFITNPGKFLKERDDKLTGDIIRQVSGVVQEVVTNAMAVGDFKSRHPEMIQHDP